MGMNSFYATKPILPPPEKVFSKKQILHSAGIYLCIYLFIAFLNMFPFEYESITIFLMVMLMIVLGYLFSYALFLIGFWIGKRFYIFLNSDFGKSKF
ncbi:hypothetical protein KPC_3487 [Acinetobacter stercoris]|uniref:Uncharacterized protein n=1 Tax=Acinetobacter stercoris TaxID=2126983 RepID=A0A2U3N422_9GAMM|nr:hypothetical protein KPC_3487 [Acinetobacter stercoris]